MTTYYLIGPGDGTNLLKKDGPLVYTLGQDQWEYNPDAITYLYEPETREITETEAKKAWDRITNGFPWVA